MFQNMYGRMENDGEFLRSEVKTMVSDFRDVASAVKDSVTKKRKCGDDDSDDDDGPCRVRNCPCKYHK